MAFSVRIHGVRDIQAGTITNDSISTSAAIVESKLSLTHTTANLYNYGLRTDESRTIENNVYVTFPTTGFKWVDSQNGRTYFATIVNGVMTLTEDASGDATGS